MKLRLALMAGCLLATCALSIGCGGDDSSATPTDAGPNPDGGDGGSAEFTAFVKTLIETETKENNRPTTTEDKSFVDSMDPAAFPPSFFP